MRELGTGVVPQGTQRGPTGVSEESGNGQQHCPGEDWRPDMTTIPKEDLKKTFREQGLRNGSSVLIQGSNDGNR